MKRFFSKSIAVVAATAMVTTGVAPVASNMVVFAADESIAAESEVMEGVFAALNAPGSDWNEFAEFYAGFASPEATIDEGYRITLSRNENEEYADYYEGNGMAFFDYDESTGFISCTISESDFWTAVVFSYMASAVADYYGMDADITNEYVMALEVSSPDVQNVSGDYYRRILDDPEHSLSTMGIYAGSAWDTQIVNNVLDSVYFDDTVINNLGVEPLTETTYEARVYNVGKFSVYAEGNKNELTLTLKERGEFDKNGLDSIINLIMAMQPNGYEEFNFQGEMGAGNNVWSVYEPTDDQLPEIYLGDSRSEFSFVQVSFSSPYFVNAEDIELKAGEEHTLILSNGEVKKWQSSNAKVAKVDNEGNIVALKKGTATIKAKLSDGQVLKCKVKVTSNPSIKIGGKKFVKTDTYTVKQGESLKVKISGKASSVKTAVGSADTSVATAKSQKSGNTVSISGVKQGSTVVKIKVNGVLFKVKVKVTA